MKYDLYQVIKFNNGEYLVLDVIKYNEDTILYLIYNNEFEDDISIVKALDDGSFDHITDENEYGFE